MSVNMLYKCIPQENLVDLIEASVLNPNAPAEYLHPGLADSDDEDEEVDDEEEARPEPGLWTESNWFGLHSLLTFREWAELPLLGESIAGGTPIGGDYSYEDSPVRYFSAEQVKEIANALNSVQEGRLQRTCDPDILNAAKVPPVGRWTENDFVYLWKTFLDIRRFFCTARDQDYAVLVYLS